MTSRTVFITDQEMRSCYPHSGFALLIVTAVLLFSFVPGEGDASSFTQGRGVFLPSNTSFPVPATGDIITTPAGQFRDTYDKWSGILRDTAFLEAHARYIFHGLLVSAGLLLVSILCVWVLTRYARRRTKQLKKTKERYRALFENMSEGIVVVVAGRLALMNPRATQITGFLPNELGSRAIAEIVTQQDRDTVKEAHRKIMRSEAKSLRFPFRITCKNGDTKWVLNNSVGIVWENTPGILSIFSDITENKNWEQQFWQPKK
ncbi:MAG: PAS domain S-box protein, partial [Syntrophorhabdaceae bacterium]|nr:PAS domain S-box protein [Syntrophorhabdaceae bacterium]